MKKFLLLIIACSALCSCTSSTSKIEREGEPEIYTVEDEDEEMNAAIKAAVNSLDTFRIALESGNEDYFSFSIKQRFDTDGGGEHIWLTEIKSKDGELYGVINNEPEFTDEVHLGDTLKIQTDRISDWMYVDGKQVKGGYTLRLLRTRMSEEEREQFDTETGLVFE